MATREARGWVVVNEEACTGCALCVEICPSGALSLADATNRRGDHYVRFSGRDCRADGLCTYACPTTDAIALLRERPAACAIA